MRKKAAVLFFLLQSFVLVAVPFNSSRWLPRYEPPEQTEAELDTPAESVPEHNDEKQEEDAASEKDKASDGTKTEKPKQKAPSSGFYREIVPEGTVTDALKAAGFSLQNNEDLLVRGQVARTTNVYIDGILANDPLTGEFDFSTLETLQIESIRVVEGDVSSAYNHCVSVYVTTKALDGFRLEAKSTSNLSHKPVWFSDNFVKLSYGLNLDFTQLVFSFRAESNKDKFYFRPLGINRYEQKYSLHENPYESLGAGIQLFFPYTKADLSFRDTTYSRDYKGAVSVQTDKMDAGLLLLHSTIDGGSYSSASANVSAREISVFGLDFAPKAIFSFGHIDTALGNKYDFDASLLARIGKAFSGDISFEFALTPKIYFSALGVKLSVAADLCWTYGKHALQAKAALLYCKPNLQQLYWQDGSTNYSGNPNLRPETGWHTEANYIYSGNVARFSTSLYFTRVVDSIHAVAKGNLIQYENSSEGIFFGGTLLLDFFPAEWLTLSLKYENVNPYITDDLKIDGDDTLVMWTYRHRLWFNAAFDLGFVRAAFSGEYVGKRPTSNTNKLWIPSYFLVGANLKFPFAAGNFFADFSASLGNPWQETTLEPCSVMQLSFGLSLSL